MILKARHGLDGLEKVPFFGLLLFYSAIYIFPDGGDTARVFYLFVALPTLALLLKLAKYSYNDSHLWWLMLLPSYLFISHFWLQEHYIDQFFYEQRDYLIRTPFFHFKKLLYIFLFLVAIFYCCKKWPALPRRILQTVFILGFISALISLACYLSQQCGIQVGRLSGFSVQDINKAGAIYTIHLVLSLYFLLYGFHHKRANTLVINSLLMSAALASTLAIYFARTDATWAMFLIMCFIALNPKWNRSAILYTVVAITLLLILAYALGLFERVANDTSFSIRIELVQGALRPWLDHPWFGLGMAHKLPVIMDSGALGVHPHNIFVDVLRYGGFIGLFFLILPLFIFSYKSFAFLEKDPIFRFCFAWFVGGIAIMAVYAQQPMTRPGGYIWMLYWMPIALVAAQLSTLNLKQKSVN